MAKPDLYGPAREALAAMLSYQSSCPDFDKPIARLQEAMKPQPTPAQLRAAGKVAEAESAAESLIDETAGRIVGEEIWLCVSWLVSELFKRTGEADSIMDDDEADALAGRGPDADNMRGQLPGNYRVEQGFDPSDGASAWRWWNAAEWEQNDAAKDHAAPPADDSTWFDTEAEAFADLYNVESLDPAEGCEAMEHWAVSRWLAEKLRAHGESVASTDWAGDVWARCTTGQMIRMDSVIRKIARERFALELTGVDSDD